MHADIDYPKLLVIALDGADYGCLSQWTGQGRLPTFSAIAREGAFGPLASTVPPATCTAWPSIFTGTNPGKHGIFNFFRFPGAQVRPEPVLMDQCAVPTIWPVLNQAGYRVGVWRLPWGFPAEQVDGYMLCDRSPLAAGITWPLELFDSLKQRFDWLGGWSGASLRAVRDTSSMFDTFAQELARERELLAYVMDNYPADVVLLGVSLIDLVGHYAAGDRRAIRELMLRVYTAVDEWLGEVMDRWVGPDTTMWIVSDHGMGPHCASANVLRALVEAGLLAFVGAPSPAKLAALRLAAAAYLRLRRRRRPKAGRTKGDSAPASKPLSSPVDWSRSAVVPWGPDMLWINYRERYPHGTVAPEEAEEVFERVCQAVGRLRDPLTGGPAIAAIHRGRDLYWGPMLDHAPDIVLVPADGVQLATGTGVVPGGWQNIEERREVLWDLKTLLAPLVSVTDPRWGHRPLGIVMARGPSIAPAASVHRASVIDVAPSLLYSLGVAVPCYMDGRVLTEAFQPAALEQSPVRYASAAPPSRRVQGQEALGDEESDALRQRLQDLGYL